MAGYFITGTDTGVGKTYVTCLLLKAMARAGTKAVGFKPIACGGREDAVQLLEAGNAELTLDDINPVSLSAPAAPYPASLIENRAIEPGELIAKANLIQENHDFIFVEGVGGWEVPITRDYFISDFAVELGLPVILVVENRLGAINHTVLTVKAIQQRGLKCQGLILNNTKEERDSASISNRNVLEQVLGIPVLMEVIHDETDIQMPI